MVCLGEDPFVEVLLLRMELFMVGVLPLLISGELLVCLVTIPLVTVKLLGVLLLGVLLLGVLPCK